jgi:Holliday junction resolvasome RuvABC ATP-dependent DNA helicase subunit
MSWIEKFEFLKGSVTQMYKGTVNSIYVYGNPETGKSYEVINTLDKLNADYKLYKGNVIKGKDDLIRILYNNREDRILVFDDADNVLTVDPNIWKTVLENTKIRILTYVDTKRRNNKDMNDIPPKFEFSSGVIFISNVPKLNSAIASRSIVMNVKLSNDEALAKVEASLKNFLPNIDMKTKREALDYAKEISNGIKNMGYRTVETIIIAMQISPSNWKKQAIWLLSSR